MDFLFHIINRPIHLKIDRIYLSKDLLPFSWDWKIERSRMSTNYALVRMSLLNSWQLYIEEGKYAMPALLIKDSNIRQQIEEISRQHLENLRMAKWKNTTPKHYTRPSKSA